MLFFFSNDPFVEIYFEIILIFSSVLQSTKDGMNYLHSSTTRKLKNKNKKNKKNLTKKH